MSSLAKRQPKFSIGQEVRAVVGPPKSMQPNRLYVGRLGRITQVHSFYGQEFYYEVAFEDRSAYDARTRVDFIDEVCLEVP